MEPEMLHTACYRGFYATYELTEDALYLRRLTLNEKNGNYVPIGGVEPERGDHEATYRGLGEVVPFTGKLRLAKDFIEDFYIHMGFQKPTAFRTVFDVTLDDGRPVDVRDRSQEMEAKRGEFKRCYESGDIREGIEHAFSLEMDFE